MKKKLLPALIVVMLIAVAAASFVILREHKDKGYDEDQSAGTASEQQDEDEADDDGDEYAETEPLATLFFASDYQEEEGFEEPSVTLSNILETANDNGKDIDMVVICGDYTNEPRLYDYQLSPDDSISEIREVVNSECPDVDAYETDEDADVLFVQGNHDRMSDQITPTGLHEYEDYLVYVLNTEEDFPWKQGKTYGCLAKVRRSSAEMKECFDKLISRGETRPVF
ncbi:MAG: metallophosphoesterase, partial [Mogibacterium sp.]|nr:metallophosphoesterase [Mogibacterium sp.]